MPKGKTLQVVFKQDFQGQGMLIPLTLEELVPADHPFFPVFEQRHLEGRIGGRSLTGLAGGVAIAMMREQTAGTGPETRASEGSSCPGRATCL